MSDVSGEEANQSHKSKWSKREREEKETQQQGEVRSTHNTNRAERQQTGTAARFPPLLRPSRYGFDRTPPTTDLLQALSKWLNTNSRACLLLWCGDLSPPCVYHRNVKGREPCSCEPGNWFARQSVNLQQHRFFHFKKCRSVPSGLVSPSHLVQPNSQFVFLYPCSPYSD